MGARAGEVRVGDSTSLNLFKSLSAAVALQRADAPARRDILSERGNFPTDLYMAESVAAAHGLVLRLADGARIDDALNDDVAVLMLTHVNYRSGRMHRLAETTRAAHAAGALVVWDLAHSAGAVPVDLHGAAWPSQPESGWRDCSRSMRAVWRGFAQTNAGAPGPPFRYL